jgi:pimeloyl-ACP methyl ester carboxylesterase
VGQYVDANGVHTYYEELGSGDPMLLLHGGGVGGDSFGDWIGWFADRYLVRVPDRRGQGHTPDVDGPLSYEVMARDTIAFIEAVGPERTHLVGWSDGGNIALMVGALRPDLVDKIVAIGAYATVDGLTEAGRASIEQVASDGSPFSAKLIACWFDERYSIDLAAVAAPTLIVAGDDDIVSNAHTAWIAESIPNAQLAIIPGASHLVPMEKPDLLRVIFRGFLEGGPPETLLPLRRATPG